MPLFEGAFGTALLAKGMAAGKGTGLLAGLLHFQAPTLHIHDSEHNHGLDVSGFLDVDAKLAPLAHAASQHDAHADFLFGASAASGAAPAAAAAPLRRQLGGLRLLPAAPAAAGALLAVPKMSMIAAVSGVAGGLAKVEEEDPFGEGKEESGWCKFVPRGLKIYGAADVLSMLVLAGSYWDTCDLPLKGWLCGGVLLGFPVSYLVKKVASSRPTFKYFRLKVTQLRGGGPPSQFKLEGLVLYDQFKLAIDRAETWESNEGDEWSVTLQRIDPELITGYQLITDKRAAAKYDPVSWTLEGSADGTDWRLLHQAESQDVTQSRGASTEMMDELQHLEDSTSAFRSAFLLEVAASALSFAWLVAGTAWVSASTDTCVDSAPLLWCSSYFIVVLVWSFLGTITVGLIVSAVAMVFLGKRSSDS